MNPKQNPIEGKHTHYWDISGAIAYKHSYSPPGTSPIVEQYVLVICHECGEVKKKIPCQTQH